jgi:hypothetical protein
MSRANMLTAHLRRAAGATPVHDRSQHREHAGPRQDE